MLTDVCILFKLGFCCKINELSEQNNLNSPESDAIVFKLLPSMLRPV